MSGTASDDSGISKVTVNGNQASLSGSSWSYTLTSLATNTTHTITIVATDGAGNTNSAVRYLRVEAFYQYSARISGTTVQSSLANTLTNSTVCAAIANNSTARSTMKTKYSSTMVSYIDSNFNDGLNTLNFQCSLKCYLFKAGNECTGVTGGWSYQIYNVGENYAQNTGSAILVKRKCAAITKNKLQMNKYSKIYFDCYYDYEYMSSSVEWYRLFADVNGNSIEWNYNEDRTPTQLYTRVGSEKDIARATYNFTISHSSATAQGVQAYTDGGLYVYNVYCQ